MKHFLLLVLLSVVVYASGNIVYNSPNAVEDVLLLESTDNNVLIEFKLSALECVETELEVFGSGSVFRIPSNGGLLATVGSPDLPVIRRMVLIPSHGNIELEIISEESQYLGQYNIAPYQESPTFSGGPSPYRINNSVYDASQTFPASSVELESVNILRDIRVAWIHYNPVSINPVTGDVFITTSVVVDVKGIGGSGENELERPTVGYTRSFLRFYDEVIGFTPVEDLEVIDGSYLFIGTEASIAQAQELIYWKRQKGLDVKIGIVPTIGSTASEIDAWIEDAFNTWLNPPEYVMLVGGDEIVPDQIPTTELYASDNQYAVVDSGVIPSMHIGRICGDDCNMNDLEYISWKIYQNEMNPYRPLGENWFRRAFSMACTDFWCPSAAQGIHELFQENDLLSDFYCSIGGTTPNLLQVISDINEGRLVINYMGHGSTESWLTTGFDISNIAALTNGRRLPWVVTTGCYNGNFNLGDYCFCEAFLSEGTIADPRGAIAIIGASHGNYANEGLVLQIHTFRGYFTEELHHLGAAHTNGKVECYAYFGNTMYSEAVINMSHLFGCPEMDIYNDAIYGSQLTNTHGPIHPGTFQVIITDDSQAPVEGALVAAYYSDTGELLDSDYSDESGIVNLTISSIPGGNAVTITSTAHNRYPDITYADQGVGIEESTYGIAPSFFLNNPVPNPVTSVASIEFGLPVEGKAELVIFDITGRVVISLEAGRLEGGIHTLSWNATTEDGNEIPNGFYILKLTSPSAGTVTRSFLVLR